MNARIKTRWIAGLLVAGASIVPPTSSDAQVIGNAGRSAQALIAGLDFDEARAELAAGDAEDPGVALERARLAVYELDCDGAVAILARPELQKAEAGEQLADIARGCQRVIAALAVDKDEERGIEVRWQDEHDRAMGPLLMETVARARDALTRDLRVDWPRPTRIVVVRDLLSLAAMTGLPYKSAQTTGTVAVAKWGRVTLLSPRASRHGYAWRDTMAHELTHLAVTRATRDRAPLWLQEGVAKREEVRWREPGPFDERPSADAVALRGQELKLGLRLDKLGPSIAMLPSADAAMVAFAEVTSFVRFFAQTEGGDALPKLMAELRAGKDPDEALVAATSMDLKGWDAKWRAYLTSHSRAPVPALLGLGERRDMDKWSDVRDRTRLAQLLLTRGHSSEAVQELDHVALAPIPAAPDVSDSAMTDPSLCWLRARALESAGRRDEAAPLVADPKEVLSSYGPWWAVRGRWARLRQEENIAIASFAEAVATDPFDPEASCESIDASALPSAGTDPGDANPNEARKPEKALCDAARAAGQPSYGED
jgi:hypothetical protein